MSAQWAQINALADEISGQWEFSLLGPNSTSFIASILSMMGINLKDVEPPDDLGNLGVDELVGGSNANHLLGFDGNDILKGGDGDDTLDGGNGNATATGDDTLLGDDGSEVLDAIGDDVLFGRDGDDVLVGNAGSDSLDGGSDDDYLFGDDPLFPISVPGDDTLLGGAGFDQLVGGSGDDSLDGGGDDDVLYGDSSTTGDFSGDDTIVGGAGNDQLVGGSGYDSLLGGAGDDTLDAAAPGDQDPELENGWDRLVGGEGADTFLCSGGDKVIDPDVDDELYLGGLLMTGGTWQYVEEFETEWWVGSHGEVYSGDLIDDVFYLYSISLFDEDWNEIDGVIIVGWDTGELGITLTGGPDQLQASLQVSFDTRSGSSVLTDRLDTPDDDDDEVTALIEGATGRPPALSVLSHGDILDSNDADLFPSHTSRWTGTSVDAGSGSAIAMVPSGNAAPSEDQVALMAA